MTNTLANVFGTCFTIIAVIIAGNCAAIQEQFKDVNGIIAAFGDYDSDKLTDVFIINQDLRSFSVLKHYLEEPYLRKANLKDNKYIECAPLPIAEKLVALIPGDYHGNTKMDVIMVSKEAKNVDPYAGPFTLRLLKGDATNFNCVKLPKHFATVRSQPLMLDYNGDMISDLMAEDVSGERKVWLGKSTGKFEVVSFSNYQAPMNIPNSNAFIDLNGDGIADIFIDGKDSYEYWFASASNGKYAKTGPHNVSRPGGYEVVGQSAFFDLNGDERVEHIVPVCKEKSPFSGCALLALNFTFNGNDTSHEWLTIAEGFSLKRNSTIAKYEFTDSEFGDIHFPITLRHGEINGDGYPDISVLMKVNNIDFVILLENTLDHSMPFKRTFKLFDVQPSLANPVVAAFFDLKEDSKLDILATTLNRSLNDATEKQLFVMSEENEIMLDTNFLKILVASGRCPNEECYKEGWVEQKYRVNYGTNQPGPFAKYNLIDQNGNPKSGCAGQLSQSSYFSLQIPYMIFGLGSYANYVDETIVFVPGGKKRHHTLPQLVPDAQVILIPHPMDEPGKWPYKLFLTPSEIVWKTLYTLLGICLSLLVIIAILHRREAIEDEKEAREFKQNWLDRR